MPERLVVMLAYGGGNLIDIAGPLQALESADRANAAAGNPAYPEARSGQRRVSRS